MPEPFGKERGAGDEIIVKENEVHSLENSGEEFLYFVFACPLDHLNEKDRVFTMDMENGVPEYAGT